MWRSVMGVIRHKSKLSRGHDLLNVETHWCRQNAFSAAAIRIKPSSSLSTSAEVVPANAPPAKPATVAPSLGCD
jgi:hypothetical protein